MALTSFPPAVVGGPPLPVAFPAVQTHWEIFILGQSSEGITYQN